MKDGHPIVLCIDDDPDILQTLRIVLETQDYVVVTAANGEEGLQRWRQAEPDVIIVDLMMEEIDAGTRLVQELRAGGNTAPVFMLSSAGDQLYAVRDYGDLGLSGILQKPVDPATLLALIKAKVG